ncbi:MAG: PhzF family phenazine biosynthesis protein [Thermoleophilaceae bacterium]|nr:PhzF family phenazine biosynthesis protein [Thermoleophilaceae bacterium]
MSRLHVLRVFCDDDGSGGNPLAVFLDGTEVPPSARQSVAADLGLSETVFVDDSGRGELHIFTPAVEMKFAGHPTVGTAWLLARERESVPTLRVPAGEVRVRYEGGASHVAARPEWAPDFEWERLDSPADVDALSGPPGGHDHIGAWAWLDEATGTVRARVFPVRYGIDEDEATGAAAVLLCARLGREIDIHQGRGSRIRARPLDEGYIEIGGRSVLEDVREYTVP